MVCEVCKKPVTRAWGMAAVVEFTARDGATMTRALPVAHGWCRAHRNEVPRRYHEQLTRTGEVLWESPEPVLLRTAEVSDFLAGIDELLSVFASEITGTAGRHPLSSTCPYCGGPVDFGEGPHVADAAARGAVTAWVCRECHASGVVD